MISYAFSCVACTFLIFMPSDSEYTYLAVFFTKLGISAAYNVCYISSVVLFPTNFSLTAFGICNIASRMVTLLAPLVAEVQQPFPSVTIAVLTFIFTFLSTKIREEKSL